MGQQVNVGPTIRKLTTIRNPRWAGYIRRLNLYLAVTTGATTTLQSVRSFHPLATNTSSALPVFCYCWSVRPQARRLSRLNTGECLVRTSLRSCFRLVPLFSGGLAYRQRRECIYARYLCWCVENLVTRVEE